MRNLQHVGPKYYSTYFQLVDFALKSKDAAVVITSSTLPESRYTDHQSVLETDSGNHC